MMEILLVLGTYVVAFVGGFVAGMVTMGVIILRQLNRETKRYMKGLNLNKDIFPGDEWKQGKKPSDKDENWLRRILGDDKNKGTK